MRRFFRRDRRKDRDKTEDRPREAPQTESPTNPTSVSQPTASTNKRPGVSLAAVASNSGSYAGHPIGLKTLHDPAEGEAVLDIIFIHGLKGHREKTWTAENAPEPWPKTLLKEEISNARVLVYGYDANVARATHIVSASRIRDHAADLLLRIRNFRHRTGGAARPIIFVCHSLGGLVCQAALSRAHKREELEEVLEATRGILFLGTPHHGSDLASWAEQLARCVGIFKQTNTAILSVLRPESEVLAEIQDDFHNILQSKTTAGFCTIHITCFFETLSLPGIGFVVPQHSATMSGKTAFGIDGNHHTMAKFSSRQDSGFIDICDQIRICIENFDRKALVVPKQPIAWPRASLELMDPVPRMPTVTKEKTKAKFLVPYAKNKDFVGRTDIFERLKSQFCHGFGDDVENARFRVCLHGLGGVGKTQVAIAYTYWLRKSRPNISIFWIHASNVDRVRQGFSEIAEVCDIPRRNDDDINVLALVKHWLERQTTDRWFLVIDNADDTSLFFDENSPTDYFGSSGTHVENTEGSLARFIPNYGNGSILVTTRNKQAGTKLVPGYLPIEVGPMNREESFQMIQEMTGAPDLSIEAAFALSTRLEHLPLAIAQAAAFMLNNSINIDQYLQILNKDNETEVQLLSRDFEAIGRDATVPRAVMATWVVSFEHIKEKNLVAAEIISLMAFFDRQSVPRKFITIYTSLQQKKHQVERYEIPRGVNLVTEDRDSDEEDGNLNEGNCDFKNRSIGKDNHQSREMSERNGTNSLHIEEALGILKAFSFIKESKNKTLEVHRLVQLATSAWLSREKLASRFISKALATIAEFFLGSSRSQAMFYQTLPHCQAVLAANAENTAVNHRLTFTIKMGMSEVYRYLGQFELSLNMMRRALDTEGLDPHDESRIKTVQFSAMTLEFLGRKEEALQTLADLVVSQPRDSATMLVTVKLLTQLYLDLEEYSKAKELLVSAIEKLEEKNSASLGNKACFRVLLAVALTKLGYTQEAEKTINQAMKLAEEACRPTSSPYESRQIMELAEILISHNKLQEAELVCNQALLGAFDRAVTTLIEARLMSKLADVLKRQGRISRAVEVQHRTVLCIRAFKELGDMEAEQTSQLALLQQETGDLESAESSMARALQLYRDIYGDIGDNVLDCLCHLGIIKFQRQKSGEGLSIIEEAHQRSLREFGPTALITKQCAEAAESCSNYGMIRTLQRSKVPVLRRQITDMRTPQTPS
ncbi:Kinesin light chain [Colletotrichum scovillei]|uniref:Kinesin light chain n=1 Tax=Colletotrichum scovillei TaxID=1209932 RepID=A0A9P7QSU3_9PEZI|nr:Kinesin light chain [Colletotrichum scovillei]KAG7040822.1 Kinesin light chain [Colletotrichum scovillei]KAG7060866.1 Kinesin light chain [Colletotrichum scovillei]